jgi:hypothetical protein
MLAVSTTSMSPQSLGCGVVMYEPYSGGGRGESEMPQREREGEGRRGVMKGIEK